MAPGPVEQVDRQGLSLEGDGGKTYERLHSGVFPAIGEKGGSRIGNCW